MQVATQAIGFAGALAGFLSLQMREHRHILWMKTLSELLFGIHYLLLGAYTAVALELIGCLRNTIFTQQIKKNRSTTGMIVLFSVIFVISGLFTWDNWADSFGILAKVLSTVAYGNKNTALIRCVSLCTGSCWMIYNVVYFSIAGIVTEACTVVSAVIGLFRFNLKIKNKE